MQLRNFKTYAAGYETFETVSRLSVVDCQLTPPAQSRQLARPNALELESGRLFYRRCLLILVTGLAVLIVAFAVLMAFQMIFFALGDALAVRVLTGFAVACLVLLVVDVLLLVGVLGVLAVQDRYEVRHRPNDQRNGSEE